MGKFTLEGIVDALNTAYHEAGHVLMYHVFGHELIDATALPSDGVRAVVHPRIRVNINFYQPDVLRAFVERELLYKVAGIITETKNSWADDEWNNLEQLTNYISINLSPNERQTKTSRKPSVMAQFDGDCKDFNYWLELLQTKCFGEDRELSQKMAETFKQLIILRAIQFFNNETIWKAAISVATTLKELIICFYFFCNIFAFHSFTLSLVRRSNR